jgi:hypothetical protein
MLFAKLDAFKFRFRKAIKITSLGFLLLRISRHFHVIVVAVYFAAISSPENSQGDGFWGIVGAVVHFRTPQH